MTAAPAQVITVNGAGLDNEGTLTLAGGTINGAGLVANNSNMSGFGTLGGSGGFANIGALSLANGNLTISNTGANSNSGNIDLVSGLQLKLTGGKVHGRSCGHVQSA